MAYLALYRKFRPRRFCDVLGQNAVVVTLKNQVLTGRAAHAYLFCGTRGTGKTSTAKIFAHAVNCRDLQDGEPCGQCSACLEGDNAPDIIEIDAASNTGVDQIRDLLEKVKFSPITGKYKVYIIDEVHMLSQSSFNALLKTLEEPPPHVIFILATTEPQKVLPTIVSRCQRFEFRRLSTELIAGSLEIIAAKISVTVEKRGLLAIARAAEGGMRDALSLLDQCVAFCGENPSYADILNVLGSMDQQFLFDIVSALLHGDCRAAVLGVNGVMESGRDLLVFCRDLVAHFRNVLLVCTCGDVQSMLECSDEAFAVYKAQAVCGADRLLRAMALLSAAEQDMRRQWPRAVLEASLIKIASPDADVSYDAITSRLSVLEQKISALSLPVSTVAASAPTNEAAASAVPADDAPPWAIPPENTAKSVPKATPVKAKAPNPPPQEQPSGAARAFERLLEILKPGLLPMVADAAYALQDGVLRVYLPARYQFALAPLNADAKRLSAALGLDVALSFEEQAQTAAADQKQRIREFFGKDVVIEEE